MTEGFRVKEYGQPVKRYCQTMDLKENPKLIKEYRKRHSESDSWKEILDGIREVGILEMEISHHIQGIYVGHNLIGGFCVTYSDSGKLA